MQQTETKTETKSSPRSTRERIRHQRENLATVRHDDLTLFETLTIEIFKERDLSKPNIFERYTGVSHLVGSFYQVDLHINEPMHKLMIFAACLLISWSAFPFFIDMVYNPMRLGILDVWPLLAIMILPHYLRLGNIFIDFAYASFWLYISYMVYPAIYLGLSPAWFANYAPVDWMMRYALGMLLGLVAPPLISLYFAIALYSLRILFSRRPKPYYHNENGGMVIYGN